MSIPKPQKCNQDWSKMKPTNGGRMCELCTKTVVDFSKKNWNEIEEIQQKGGNSICGKYTPKQIEHWGMQVPSSTPSLTSKTALVAASALALTLGQVAPSESQAQTFELHQTAEPKEGKAMLDSLSKIAPQPIVIQGMVSEKREDGTLEPLIGANVYLLNTKKGVVSTIDGKFRLEVDQEAENIKKDTLVVSFIAYNTVYIPLDSIELGKTVMNVSIEANESEYLGVCFIGGPSRRTTKIGWKIKNLFRRKR